MAARKETRVGVKVTENRQYVHNQPAVLKRFTSSRGKRAWSPTSCTVAVPHDQQIQSLASALGVAAHTLLCAPVVRHQLHPQKAGGMSEGQGHMHVSKTKEDTLNLN